VKEGNIKALTVADKEFFFGEMPTAPILQGNDLGYTRFPTHSQKGLEVI